MTLNQQDINAGYKMEVNHPIIPITDGFLP